MDQGFWYQSKNSLPCLRFWRYFIFFLKVFYGFKFYVFNSILRNLELILYKVWDIGQGFLFCLPMDAYASFVKMPVFLPLSCFCTFVKNQTGTLVGIYFWVLHLVYWSVCLSLCQCSTVWIIVAIYKLWNRVNWLLPLCFSFFKIILAVLVLLHFHTSFIISCQYLQKNLAGLLVGIVLNLYISWDNWHLYYVESFYSSTVSLHSFKSLVSLLALYFEFWCPCVKHW